MYLIPESWSHLHLLVSVFPSVGLVFVLGVYLYAFHTNNEATKRICLLFFGCLGLLAIPTYFSGEGSMLALASNPDISQDRVYEHMFWGNFALALVAAMGAVSWYELWRSKSSGRLSNNALHLVMGLAFATLAMMMVIGNMGWQIAHHELQLAQVGSPGISASDIPEGSGTPQAWSHVHIILNHFPTVGFVLGLGFFLFALQRNNDGMKRTSLAIFAICGILGAPTYVTGAASMWALTDPPVLMISQAAINAHRDMALLTLVGLAFTGVTAWLQLWRYRYSGRFSQRALYMVLGFAVVTLGIMAETGHRGGQINHPEIRVDPLPTADAASYISPQIELLINNVIWFVPWQTVHFFGYSLVFGTVLAIALRVLGVWKALPFSAVHRLLPLGVFGVVMNVFTGMLMLMADTFRYTNEASFIPKMILLPIGAIAVLYFSLSERVWNTKAGEDAPMTAKWIAVLVLLAWSGVIMGGRLLPYT
jgi:uncharacterized membrane protein